MQQRRNDRGRPRGTEPPRTRTETERPRDPGAYIGRKPERATETVPGGVGRKDVRVAGVATQSAPVRGDTGSQTDRAPEGHTEGEPGSDDRVKEAGSNR